MKTIQALVLFIIFSFISCSSYTVKGVLEKSPVRSLKSSGIVLRVGSSSFIQAKDYTIDLTNWISGYKKSNKLEIINDADVKLSVYGNEDRFYQLGAAKEFLKYKSIGTITQFINSNRDGLNKLLAQKNLDSIMIYEVDSVFSAEMFFIDFTSMIVVLDKNLNIIYLDHQADYFDDLDVDGGDTEKITKQTLNTVNRRFIEKMMNFGYLTDK